MQSIKQQILKPQDLVVALKIATANTRELTLTTLGQELSMVVSAVHGSISRCEQARLLTRAAGPITALKPALLEFTIHGARYAFPAMQGSLTRGMPTSLAGPSLSQHFDQSKGIPLVWPDPQGDAYGTSLVPLHHTVTSASRQDPTLYEVLSLLDAIRAGAAREREMATELLSERLS